MDRDEFEFSPEVLGAAGATRLGSWVSLCSPSPRAPAHQLSQFSFDMVFVQLLLSLSVCVCVFVVVFVEVVVIVIFE